MAENSDDLERLSREQLILKARVLGVERPELMTRVEMRDEIVRRSEPDIAQQKRARGFLGVARDLVASPVTVRTPAGDLRLVWERADASLAGPAEIVAKGEFYL